MYEMGEHSALKWKATKELSHLFRMVSRSFRPAWLIDISAREPEISVL